MIAHVSVMFCLLAGLGDPPSRAEQLNWTRIVYPERKVKGGSLLFIVENGHDLTLRVFYSLPLAPIDKSAQNLSSNPLVGNVFAELQGTEPGQTIKALATDVTFGSGNLSSISYVMVAHFPWLGWNLKEAWIKILVLGEEYWLEVPYGYTQSEWRPSESNVVPDGRPKIASDMKNSKPPKAIVPWERVSYDLGRGKVGDRIGIEIENHEDANMEVVLFRDWNGSMANWDLHSPRTCVIIKTVHGENIEGRPVCIRLQDDDDRVRRDSFRFPRTPEVVERCWGTAVIKIDAESYRCIVPSSMFNYEHGRAVAGN